MANKYTQLTRTPYIPQYSPPNFGALQQAGQNLYQRQQQGIQRYDALQESMNQLDVMEEDKEILERKRNEIQSQLSEFADTNDFIDAQPALRKQARNLSRSLSEGELAIAVENKASALKTFEAIENSDWSAQQKEKMKEMYLRDYEGADKTGRLGTMYIPDYVNVEETFAEIAKSVEPEEKETLVAKRDPVTGGLVRASETVSQRNPERVQEAIASKYKNDPKLQEALRLEAQMEGYETQEEINEYANQRVSSMALDMAKRYQNPSSTLSNIQWDDMEGTDPNNSWTSLDRSEAFTVQGGILKSHNIVPDVNEQVSKYASPNYGEKQDKKAIKNGLQIVATNALKDGVINNDEYNYFFSNLDNRFNTDDGQYHSSGRPVGLLGGTHREDVPRFLEKPTQQENTKFKQFKEIKSKLHEYNAENNGSVGTFYAFDNKEQRENSEEILANSSAPNFKIIGEENQKENVDDEHQFIAKVKDKGKLQGIQLNTENELPIYQYQLEEDGQYETVFLQEKDIQGLKDRGENLPLRSILSNFERNDPAVDKLLDTYSLNKVQPRKGENLIDELPQTHREQLHSLGIDHYELNPVEGTDTTRSGYTMNVTNPQTGDVETFTKFRAWQAQLGNIMRNARAMRQSEEGQQAFIEQYSNVIGMVEKASNLTDPEKEQVIESIRSGNINGISESIFRDLQISYGDPYKFESKLETWNMLENAK